MAIDEKLGYIPDMDPEELRNMGGAYKRKLEAGKRADKEKSQFARELSDKLIEDIEQASEEMMALYEINPEEFNFDTYIREVLDLTREGHIERVRKRHFRKNFSVFGRIRDFGERVNESIQGLYKEELNTPAAHFLSILLQPLKLCITPLEWKNCENKRERGELIGYGLSGIVNTAATVFAGITSGPIGGFTTYVLGSFVCDYFFAGGAGALASESKGRKAIEDKFNQEILPMHQRHYEEIEKALRERYKKLEEERRKIDNLVNNVTPVDGSVESEKGKDKKNLSERVRE